MRAFKVAGGFVVALLVAAGLLAAVPETPVAEYAARRARLAGQVSAPVVLFGYNNEDLPLLRAFRQENNFYYLTGHAEPGAVLLLVPQTAEAKAAGLPADILFVPSRSRRAVVYDGLSVFADDPDAAKIAGVEATRPLSELQETLAKVLEVFPDLYTLLPARRGAEVDSLHAARRQAWLQTGFPKAKLVDARPALAAMRVIKSKTETEWLRFATETSREGHLAAMRALRPGLVEHEIAAAMEYEFRRRGCGAGYASIVGSGPNSVILHYNVNNRRAQAGEVVVLDVAAECGGYVSDITRTLPVSGKFSERQRQIYEIVLGAQEAAIAAVKPGMVLVGMDENSLNRIAREYIRKRGEEIGEDLTPYILHGLGHYVGLSVHDAGSYRRPLEAGMIITIEPGIYIAEENLGVRIEDVVLVTENGGKVLSAALPKTIEKIEQLMSQTAKSSK